MDLYDDGSIANTSLPLIPTSTDRRQRSEVVLARIDEVVFSDDVRNTSKNSTNKQTQYSVTILEGPEGGGRIFGVIDGKTKGDGTNFEERIRKPTTATFQGQNRAATDNTDGEYVLVTFLNKNPNAPVIIGSAANPKNSEHVAKKADGIRSLKIFNGVRDEIDKDGNYSKTVGSASLSIMSGGNCSFGDGTQSLAFNGGTTSLTSGSMAMSSSGGMSMDCGGGMNMAASGMNMNSSSIAMGGGGPPMSRLGDVVMVQGLDSMGGLCVWMGQIIVGSSAIMGG